MLNFFLFVSDSSDNNQLNQGLDQVRFNKNFDQALWFILTISAPWEAETGGLKI